MNKITVNASKTYEIVIGAGLLSEAGRFARETVGGLAAGIIMDDTVAELFGKPLTDSLVSNGYRTSGYVFPHGEESKNADTFLSILNIFAAEGLSRTDLVVALGGGVTGDLAGFAAACYMRGIGLVQIPTTLLAMVDSSVGGKTAINLAAGKNLAGAFYQPDLVLCDVSLLCSLPPEVFRDGCAEVIKYGAIADRALFESLIKPVNEHLSAVITRCLEIKRDIVTIDEFDNGKRKLLNFGHTVGHAIELLSGYKTSHGNAVAAGMAVVTRAAFGMGVCDKGCLQSIIDMLSRYGLQVNTPYRPEELARACLSDKKRDGSNLTMVFPVEIGKCELKEIPVGELETVLRLGL